ncbi:MAG: response regulator [Clostridiales bacterium]|nr:response regulator [Clostridiales bacterium]
MVDYEKYTVLIVDDEMNILKALKRDLRNEPYKMRFASSGADALQVFAEEGEISVILTDMRMPGMTGLELLDKINAISPDTVKLVLTGYTQMPQILATVNKVDIYKFLTKPWDIENEIKVYLREAIEIYEERKIMGDSFRSQEQKNKIFNKMLVESYEKSDYMSHLYEELIKAYNYHNLLTLQELNALHEGDQFEEMKKKTLEQVKNRVYYLNRIFDFGKQVFKAFDIYDIKHALQKRLGEIGCNDVLVEVEDNSQQITFMDNFKLLTNVFTDILDWIISKESRPIKIFIKQHPNKNIVVVMLEVDCDVTEAFKSTVESQGKFVQHVVQSVGGKVKFYEDDKQFAVKMLFPVKVKSEL